MTAKNKNIRTGLGSGRKELNEIIETCNAIAERKFNPFFLDVKLGLETVRQYFPHWELFEDNCRDAHTLNRLSEVVRLQNTQLKFQSSALYADPQFIARKIERMSEKRLAEVFLQSWHPLTELEQLTNEAMSNSLDYWNLLSPIAERWKKREFLRGKQPEAADSSTLTGLGMGGEEFGKQLTALWNELRSLHDTDRTPIEYWRFVRAGSYKETVQRAYFVSFLVTYGYAKLHSESDRLLLTPLDEPSGKPAAGGVSYPIPILKEP